MSREKLAAQTRCLVAMLQLIGKVKEEEQRGKEPGAKWPIVRWIKEMRSAFRSLVGSWESWMRLAVLIVQALLAAAVVQVSSGLSDSEERELYKLIPRKVCIWIHTSLSFIIACTSAIPIALSGYLNTL